MLDEHAKAAVRSTVSATLRQMAEWGLVWDTGFRARDELLSLAGQVDGMEEGGLCCPMCQEIECDGDCPLASVRGAG